MEKRTKLWRRKHMFRVFKARLILISPCYSWINGRKLNWKDLAKEHHVQKYRTLATPCSCEACHGGRYDRVKYKRETRRIIKESIE